MPRSYSNTQPRGQSCRLPSKLSCVALLLSGQASSGGADVGFDLGKKDESVRGASPVSDDVWAGPGKQGGEEETDNKVQPIKDSASQDELWVPMTKTEKRRLWLRRRKAGEFFFRSEFKGLVHAVCGCEETLNRPRLLQSAVVAPGQLTLKKATKQSLSPSSFSASSSSSLT